MCQGGGGRVEFWTGASALAAQQNFASLSPTLPSILSNSGGVCLILCVWDWLRLAEGGRGLHTRQPSLCTLSKWRARGSVVRAGLKLEGFEKSGKHKIVKTA